jgi:hypothetical protein
MSLEDLIIELNEAKSKYNEKLKIYSSSLYNNPYLGKIVGDYYITTAGVKKKINGKLLQCNADIVSPLPGKESIDLLNNLPIGSDMEPNSSCGYEGKNIIIAPSKLQSNTIGCFLNTELKDEFIPIGPKNIPYEPIINGNFYLPRIKTNSYLVANSIVGWTGQFSILNASKDWWYPIPYPNGFQAVNLQKTNYIQQSITIQNNTNIQFYACGRPNYGPNPIQIKFDGKIIQTITPKQTWDKYIVSIPTGGINKLLTFQGTASNDLASAITSVMIIETKNPQKGMTKEKCKEVAMINGSPSFTYDSNGYCMISKPSYVPQKPNSIPMISGEPVVLWSSDTMNQGVSASLSQQGQLIVWDVNTNPVYQSPLQVDKNVDYIGCYRDKDDRAMTLVNGGSRSFTHDSCMKEAEKTLSSYYGLQWYDGHELAQCTISNDISSVKKHGTATNCLVDSLGNKVGSDWSNAVFSTNPSGKDYFLIVEDSGNMSIFLGSSPNDKQKLLWATNTKINNGSQNLYKSGSKGFGGKSWISSNDLNKLAIGQFIGSPQGYVYLSMEPSGNLILYSNASIQGCKGDNLTSTMYSNDASTPWSLVGKSGTVDSDGMLIKSNSFIDDFFEVVGTIWADGQGTKINNIDSKEKCKSECIKDKTCSEYSFSKLSGCRLNASDNPITQFKYDEDDGFMAKRKQSFLIDNSAPFEVNATIYNGYNPELDQFNILHNIDPEGIAHIQQLENRVMDLINQMNKNSKPSNFQQVWNNYYDHFFKTSSQYQTEIDHINDIYTQPENTTDNEMQFIYICAIAIIVLLVVMLGISYVNV